MQDDDENQSHQVDDDYDPLTDAEEQRVLFAAVDSFKYVSTEQLNK